MPLTTLEFSDWKDKCTDASATDALETGNVLFLPRLKFNLLQEERQFLSPIWSDGKAKNISYDPARGEIRHTSATGESRADMAAMMARFAHLAYELITGLCPDYTPQLVWGLTSFRPMEASGRISSPKKDDTRVHVDAFTSRPNQGARILRVFSNINPAGAPRVWELGEAFTTMAEHFISTAARPWPYSAWLLEQLHVTKGRRSEYDHIMLHLHDSAKLDDDYQRSSPKTQVKFPAQSTWVVFTDQVMHAALSGQYMLEQTFYLPVAAMKEADRAPLRILEKLRQRTLA